MKKAKLMLASIAVVTIVSGAFAFSAKKGADFVYWTQSPGATAPATNSVQNATLIANQGVNTITPAGFFYTDQPNTAATATYYYDGAN